MSVDEMRSAIAKVYPGQKWKNKVYFMPDNQVIAIYYSFEEKGRFVKSKKPKLKAKQLVEQTYEQLTIFDFIKENK